MGEFLDLFGISFGFPFTVYQPLKAGHSLHLGTERYMTPPEVVCPCLTSLGLVESVHGHHCTNLIGHHYEPTF